MPKAPKVSFYAVRVGRRPGIYDTWDECVEQVKKYPNAKFKRFRTMQEAEEFVNASGGVSHRTNEATTSANAGIIRPVPSSSSSVAPQAAPAANATIPATPSVVERKSTPTALIEPTRKGVKLTSGLQGEQLVVFSDGACKGNGQAGSIAGVGVWWGHDDPRNIAERCAGSQTNNRAELIAIIRVLESTQISSKPLIIKTDSQYSIKCIRDWLSKWKSNGWRGSNGKAVANKPVIHYLSALLDYRGLMGQKVTLEYVKGHAGIEGNEMADLMANQGARFPEVQERDWDGLRVGLEAGQGQGSGKAPRIAPSPISSVHQAKVNRASDDMKVSVETLVDDNFDDIDPSDLFSDSELREMERTQNFA